MSCCGNGELWKAGEVTASRMLPHTPPDLFAIITSVNYLFLLFFPPESTDFFDFGKSA